MELLARLSKARSLADIAKQGRVLLGAATAVLDWGTDGLYLRDVVRASQGLYAVTEADILACLDLVDKNGTCMDWDALRAECGADVTVEVGAVLIGALALCNAGGFLGDALKASVALGWPVKRAGGEAGHRRHGMLEIGLVLVEDVPMLGLTVWIEYGVKPLFVPGGAGASPFAVMSMVFGVANGLVRAVAGANEFKNAKLLAEQDAATERTANILAVQQEFGDLAEDVRVAFSASSDTLDLTAVELEPDTIKAIGAWLVDASSVCLVIVGPNGSRIPIHETEATELDLAGAELKSGDVALVAELLFRGFMAALNSLTLDSNCIFGTLDVFWGNGTIKTLGEADKFSGDCDSFLAALKDSQIKNLSLQNTGVGPLTLQKLATSLIAALNAIMLDECLLTGTKIKDKGYSYETIEQLDADLSGFTALCSSLSSSQIVSISLRKCYLGPQALTLLTDAIKGMAALNSLTIDSTGVPKLKYSHQSGYAESGPRTYTLTASEKTIDLSSKNLGVADVNLVAVWMKRPEVSAAVEALAVGANPIGTKGGHILTEAIKSSNLKTIDIGKPLP
eukprot:COSAG06_NODE_7391_length_2521_cov_2.207680_1_plen_565_part_01